MDTISVWDGMSTTGTSIILVPKHLESDFIDIYQGDCFDEVPNHVYILADSASSEEDIALTISVLSKRYRCCLAEYPRLFEIMVKYSKCNIFPGFSLGIEHLRVRGLLSARIYKSLKSVFEKFDELALLLDTSFPHSFGNNWLDAELTATKIGNVAISSAPYGASVIDQIYFEKLDSLKSVFSRYVELKVSEKLSFLASYFLSRSELLLSLKDPTLSVVMMHRSVETLFISWLVDERAVTIGPDGKVIGDKYRYLKDYMQMVRTIRSLSDKEVESISRLNELRNETIYAHGYVYLNHEEVESLLAIIMKMFLQEARTATYVSAFREVTYFDDDLIRRVYSYLLDFRYLTKL